MKKSLFIVAVLYACLPAFSQPLNDIVERNIVKTKKVLDYQPLQERDIFWEKRTWRVLDVREKMNLAFMAPQAPLFDILTQAALDGKIQLYSADEGADDFSYALSNDEINNTLFETDTVQVWSDINEPTLRVIQNSIFYEDIKRYRIKETWFFDSKTSTMQVRILGIAPLKEVYNERGEFRYEKPLFWIHYPSSREELSRHTVFTQGNDSSQMTWEDLFEMRKFASYIYKESNVQNNRLEDLLSGVDLLLESDKINREIFNFEHDLWSY